MHRRSDPWTEPLAFRPSASSTRARRAAYLPFGQGPRLCIGREFALGEMVMVLDEVLREHRLEVPAGWSRPEPQARVAVHPRGGMPLWVTRLDGSRT